MSDDPRTSRPLLEVTGQAADHLYREGSAKASFWEAIFGSSLRAKNRTHISALPDGTRMFDVPLLGLESDLLRRAHVWMTSEAFGGDCREAASLLAAKRVRVRLIGLQPRGQAVATFTLRFEPSELTASPPPSAEGTFRSWFGAEGDRIATEALIPFGFTPQRG
ncbi:MAG: hypothetical protein KA385_01355 [Vicinamibacteria bacterium]|jgi:hypothetical protein|nr:hypothetical protein [Vicinamibacteria bacterium]